MLLKLNDKRLAAIIFMVCAVLATPPSFASGATASVFRFQQKMANKGLPQAQYKLAMMYESGAAVEKNLIQAKSWYRRAAAQNFKPAKHRLTYLDIRQNGYRDQHANWVNDLKRDAVFGEGEALFLLGQMYADGTGIQRDLGKSLKLLRKAAASNIAGSETELIRVESIYLAEKDQAEKQRLLKAAEIKQVEQMENRKLQQQRQKRLDQQRIDREKHIIAQRQRQLELTRKRQAEQARANQEQLARLRAQEVTTIQPSILVTETNSSNICSGRNRFSATCR